VLPLALFSLPSSSAPGNQYKRTDFGNRDHDSSDISNQTEFLPATTKKGSDEPAPVRARASRALLHYIYYSVFILPQMGHSILFVVSNKFAFNPTPSCRLNLLHQLVTQLVK
jgi:hypothetical protein